MGDPQTMFSSMDEHSGSVDISNLGVSATFSIIQGK